ncbi:hypothetical protein [Paludisphaera mucosa]|uniref:Uncharacterized protein n=1 Tax=Paludisphaera mucosa TaxID=3030827 RepID=A0ABT6FD42_9BACT|nr:hypothetical protein [Paludisphaera mucosa]MDG3005513.1 hypothetical protein [Paludisphaera mucosa]
MTAIQVVLIIARNYKTYAAVAAAVASGIGMLLAKNYDQGLETICQGLLVLFSGASALGVHAAAMAKPGRL